MLHIILKVAKFQLSPPSRLSRVVKNIGRGGGGGASFQIGLRVNNFFIRRMDPLKKKLFMQT